MKTRDALLGLAGLLYGAEAIPPSWRSDIARADDIEDLARRLEAGVNRR